MQITKKRRVTDIVQGFFLLCHPLPVLFHLLAVSGLILLAAWPHIAWNVFILLVTAHAAMQLSIAVLNDYCDRQLDTISKKNKPIPRGLVYPREALISGLVLIVVMVLLLFPLNLWALFVSLLYLALGQGYNLGLKSTPWSGIVFAIAIPLIPLYAFAGTGHMLPLVFWLIPVAAFLGIALNLANSLPDLEDDAANHAHTLAVVLGVRGSFVVCSACLLLSVVLIAILTITQLVPTHGWLIGPILLFSALAIIAFLFFFGPIQPVRLRKLYFYLIVLFCLILASGWLLSAAS